MRLLIAGCLVLNLATIVSGAHRPNVLLVITDDQGYGDLGANGNPRIRTPHLDAFATESVRLNHFYVCPVCSPTRASLMTGRYNYRTGVVDTYIGRSLMRPTEVTLAEHLGSAGYRTGLFGKWHLGDNYPLRPEDQGFQQTLWSQGGGLAQPSDPPGVDSRTAYFDPLLRQNGQEVKTRGYCTDVFTEAALRFIQTPSEKPFFAYVAYNCPHGPFQVPDAYAEPYRKQNLTASGFPKIGQPWTMGKWNAESIARAYGMIENIDQNMGRLLQAIPRDTIVIFLTDNGPGGVRFNGGLRDRKTSVYEGGIRVPCFVRWPGKTKPHVIDTALAHIDIVPTLLDLCDVKPAAEAPARDGRSFRGLLLQSETNWPTRTLFTQWHRGDAPVKGRAFCARGPRYKLVQAAGANAGDTFTPHYELFDILADPFEERDLAAEKPQEVAKLKQEYEAWFEDVTRQGFAPARIVIGNKRDNPARLTRQDWRGPNAGWTPTSEGHWQVRFEQTGSYQITLISKSPFQEYELTLGNRVLRGRTTMETKSHTIQVPNHQGDQTVSARVNHPKAENDKQNWRGVDYLVFELIQK